MRYTFLRQTNQIYPPTRVKQAPRIPDLEDSRQFREIETRNMRIAQQASAWLTRLATMVEQGATVNFVDFVQQLRAEVGFTSR